MSPDLQGKLANSIESCKENGLRILDDARLLFDYGSYSTSYALAKISQEEFSKGFILRLVDNGALRWTPEVRRSLNHHVSKQLMVVILDFLNPEINIFLSKIENNALHERPIEVCDTINIYIHEILRRWESSNWFWSEDPTYTKDPQSILKGKEDKLKQNAFYIRIDKDGRAISSVKHFTKDIAYTEIEKAERCCHGMDINQEDYNFQQLLATLRLMIELMEK